MTFLEQTKSYEQIKQEWFQQWFNKSGSHNSLNLAKMAMNTFNDFINTKYPTLKEEQIINDLKLVWDDPKKFTQLYLFLNEYVQYMVGMKKNPRTTRIYFTFVKSLLRHVGIRIHNEDVKQFVHFPKLLKELRQPLTYDIIKTLLEHTRAIYKAIILVAVSSGARLGEILQARVRDFTEIEVNGNKVIQFRIRATNTKTREERYTFISKEAWEAVKPLLIDKKPEDFIFIDQWNQKTVLGAEMAFRHLRERCGFTEKYGNGFNFHVNFHSLRAFFLTKAIQRHGENYGHALIGHHKYLDQYFRLTIEERAQKYLELEPDVTISNDNRNKAIIAKQSQDLKRITELEERLAKAEDEIKRNKILIKKS